MGQKTDVRLSYADLEALSLKYYGTTDQFAELAEMAVYERGGHCRTCNHCISICGEKPKPMPHILKQEHIAVRVNCSIDLGRRHPYRDGTAQPESCPSLRRYLQRSERMVNRVIGE